MPHIDKRKNYRRNIFLCLIVLFFISLQLVQAANYGEGDYGKGSYGVGEEAVQTSTTTTATSGGGGSGGKSFSGCLSNNDCSPGLICRDGDCLRLFDIKLIHADSPMIAGEFLDFSYLIKEMSQISDDVIISYSLEDFKTGKAFSTGEETIFIARNEDKVLNSRLWIPSSIQGLYKLNIKVHYLDYSATASQTIEILKVGTQVDEMISFNIYMEEKSLSGKADLNFYIFSNTDEEKSVSITNLLIRNSEVVIKNEGRFIVSNTLKLPFKTSELPAGSYKVVMLVKYKDKTTSFEKEIEIAESNIFSNKYLKLIIAVILAVLILIEKKSIKKIKEGKLRLKLAEIVFKLKRCFNFKELSGNEIKKIQKEIRKLDHGYRQGVIEDLGYYRTKAKLLAKIKRKRLLKK
ncbi:hypothetical protein HYV89_01725 [Candidatus Woesearchaeota archaeon]|nr:hypothetical protein [Candidatus Woesearchaeota archaeon]